MCTHLDKFNLTDETNYYFWRIKLINLKKGTSYVTNEKRLEVNIF